MVISVSVSLSQIDDDPNCIFDSQNCHERLARIERTNVIDCKLTG